MLVPSPHLFRLMPHEVVNDSIINTRSRQVGGKGVAKTVEADPLKVRALYQSLEVSPKPVWGQWLKPIVAKHP